MSHAARNINCTLTSLRPGKSRCWPATSWARSRSGRLTSASRLTAPSTLHPNRNGGGSYAVFLGADVEQDMSDMSFEKLWNRHADFGLPEEQPNLCVYAQK